MCTVLCTFVYYRVLLAKVCVCVHTPLYIGGVHSTQPDIQYTVHNTLNKQWGLPPPVIANYSA